MFCIGLMQTEAQVRLAHIFTNDMVLQRNAPIRIWGWASPGEKVTVQLMKQAKSTTADDAGKWLVSLDEANAGGPHQLTVTGSRSSQVLQNILIGDVWLCGGQSNMEWILHNTEQASTEEALPANKNIRHVKVERSINMQPEINIKKTAWQVASPATVGNFSAVGYYFAKALQKEMNVPIGLVNSTWGGTMIESWISRDGLQYDSSFAAIAGQLPISMEQFEQMEMKRLEAKVQQFQKPIPHDDVAHWISPQYNDSLWSSINVPMPWEDQGLPGYDGVVYYRKDFFITEEQLKENIQLHLGTIDDVDYTYVNGVMLGETSRWDAQRIYTVPRSALKKGKNTIVVKVLDTGGGGGFYGSAGNVYLQVNGKSISLAGKWKARVDLSFSFKSFNPNSMPTILYNAMIDPISGLSIKGVIWYQGETNVNRAVQYGTSFPMLIADWRTKFGQPEMPFYFVQLSSYNANNENGTNGSRWAELREAQLHTSYMPHTGMAVSIDVGNSKDIHPRNKKTVGERLALLALRHTYQKNWEASGPIYKDFRVADNKIIIRFNHIGKGLVAAKNDKGILTGFMIAGSNKKFRWATAQIVNNEVQVWHNDISEPVAVRYAWVDDATNSNLYNKEGLPASPFRTDKWRLNTQNIKYIIAE